MLAQYRGKAVQFFSKFQAFLRVVRPGIGDSPMPFSGFPLFA
jgi:hypothetical protein